MGISKRGVKILSSTLLAITMAVATCDRGAAGSDPIVVNLWPADPPAKVRSLPPEVDKTQADDPLIAGRRVIRLGNVSTPQLAVYPAATSNATGAGVVICPGGGNYILAYDLEGTEVAAWLNSIGVTAFVLKYRVPTANQEKPWHAPVQDAQRAVSLVRHHADRWGVNRDRVGILGFSAGGETAALTSTFLDRRQYDRIDRVDEQSSCPDFTLLIYPGGLVEEDRPVLLDHVKVSKQVSPMFMVHAFDDSTSVQNSLLLASALKEVDVPTELHVYRSGGHGYGLRPTEQPITRWPKLAEQWMRRMGFLKRR